MVSAGAAGSGARCGGGGCSLGCWARRGLRQQEGKQRGREPGGNAATSRPEEEAVAMVGALRGNAPGPSSSSLRTPLGAASARVSARTRCGDRNPRTHRHPPKVWPGWGGLPNHRGSRRLIDGGQAPAGQSRRPFVRGGGGITCPKVCCGEVGACCAEGEWRRSGSCRGRG